MALPFNIYLANIPFLNKNYLITNGKEVKDTGIYNSVEIINVNFISNIAYNRNYLNVEPTSISFIIDIDDNSFFNVLWNKYNAVYFSDSTDENYRIYRIEKLTYVSSKKVRIEAVETIYNIIKSSFEVTSNINVSLLKSHETFIRYGYAYDSILNTSGNANFSINGDTDLYTPISEEIVMPLTRGLKAIEQNYGLETLTTWLNNKVRFWVVVYLQPDTYTVDTKSIVLNKSTYEGMSLPYAVLSCPFIPNNVYKLINRNTGLDDETISIENLFTFINAIDQSKIYTIKCYPYSMFMRAGSASIDDTNLIISNTTFANTYGTGLGFFYVKYLNGSFISNPITTDFTGYPKMYDSSYTFTNDDLATTENPYIAGNTNILAINDFMGNRKNLNLIWLGNYTQLLFKVVMPQLLETSTYYVDFASNSSNSLYKNVPSNQMNYLVGSMNFSLSYTIDALNRFLGSNTNWYKSNMNTLKNNLSKIIVKGFSSLGSSAEKAVSEPTLLQAAQDVNASTTSFRTNLLTGAMDFATAKRNLNYQLENIENSPDELIQVSSDIMLYNSVLKPRIYLVWYSATDLQKELLLRNFLYKGLHLNKYISSSNVNKYINITNNKYDKTYLKYVEGDFDLYYNQPNQPKDAGMLDYKQLDKLSRLFTDGCKLVRYNTTSYTLNDNNFNENNIQNIIDEETFNG